MEVQRNIGNRMENVVLERARTVGESRMSRLTQEEPMMPAVKSSAIAWPAALNAPLVVLSLTLLVNDWSGFRKVWISNIVVCFILYVNVLYIYIFVCVVYDLLLCCGCLCVVEVMYFVFCPNLMRLLCQHSGTVCHHSHHSFLDHTVAYERRI